MNRLCETLERSTPVCLRRSASVGREFYAGIKSSPWSLAFCQWRKSGGCRRFQFLSTRVVQNVAHCICTSIYQNNEGVVEHLEWVCKRKTIPVFEWPCESARKWQLKYQSDVMTVFLLFRANNRSSSGKIVGLVMTSFSLPQRHKTKFMKALCQR